jgi:hypothetical protein
MGHRRCPFESAAHRRLLGRLSAVWGGCGTGVIRLVRVRGVPRPPSCGQAGQLLLSRTIFCQGIAS